jgi:hypothetical protein
MNKVQILVRRVYKLLKKTQPMLNEYDVVWWGPYFIPRSRQWYPSHFTLYDGTLYVRLFIGYASYGLSWKVGSNAVEFERGPSGGDYYNDDYLWTQTFVQIERRMRFAIKDFSRYNRFVENNLPLTSRTGKIQRHLTWPRTMRSALPKRQIGKLERLLEDVKGVPRLSTITVDDYLHIVATAYNATFKELRPLSPLQKYKKRADSRHGGLLDLPSKDPKAFAEWFHSRRWTGAHPWEIVFGHPHGIMLSPHFDENHKLWSYALWVDSLGWYATAARMAIALGDSRVPLTFHDHQKVLDALKGIDFVDIGPDLDAVHYDELKEKRQDSLRFIEWDEIPQLSSVTTDQVIRIKRAEVEKPKDAPATETSTF